MDFQRTRKRISHVMLLWFLAFHDLLNAFRHSNMERGPRGTQIKNPAKFL